MKDPEPPEVENELRQFLLTLIADWEPRLHENLYCYSEERDNAPKRNRRREFRLDPEIPEYDLVAILAYIEEYESVDARIISMKFVDEDTVEIMTGEIKGPLNGGGHFFVARRENGEWIFSHASDWIS